MSKVLGMQCWGGFPGGIQVNDTITGGVAVSFEWVVAYYWRVKKWNRRAIVIDAATSLTCAIDWPGSYPLPELYSNSTSLSSAVTFYNSPTYFTSNHFLAADRIHRVSNNLFFPLSEADLLIPRNIKWVDLSEPGNDISTVAVSFSSGSGIVSQLGTFPFGPVDYTYGPWTGATAFDHNYNYPSVFSGADSGGSYGTVELSSAMYGGIPYSGFDPALSDFYRKSGSDQIYFKPLSAEGQSNYAQSYSFSQNGYGYQTSYLVTATYGATPYSGGSTWTTGTAEIDSLATPPGHVITGSKTVASGSAGAVKYKIAGFADVIVPLYYVVSCNGYCRDEQDRGMNPLADPAASGHYNISYTMEAASFWHYDGLWNGTTGELL